MSKEVIQVKAEDISELLYEVYDVPSGICEQIKDMVQRLESVNNSNPSEALGKIAILASELGTSKDIKFTEIRFPKMLLVIQQALLKAQEQDFNYNKILMPFVNELAEILGVKDTDGMIDKIRQQNKALKIIKEKPYESASTINYIQINKDNPKMLDYEHYTMTVKDALPEEDFDSLEEMILNA